MYNFLYLYVKVSKGMVWVKQLERKRAGFEVRMRMKDWFFVSFFSLFIFNEYPFDSMFEFVFKAKLMKAADINQYFAKSVRDGKRKEEGLLIWCLCNY